MIIIVIYPSKAIKVYFTVQDLSKSLAKITVCKLELIWIYEFVINLVIFSDYWVTFWHS